MSKSKRQKVRERQRRQKMRSYLTWDAARLAALVIVGFFVFQGSGQSSSVGEQVEVPADYVNHIEEGTDPSPLPSDPQVATAFGKANRKKSPEPNAQ